MFIRFHVPRIDRRFWRSFRFVDKNSDGFRDPRIVWRLWEWHKESVHKDTKRLGEQTTQWRIPKRELDISIEPVVAVEFVERSDQDGGNWSGGWPHGYGQPREQFWTDTFEHRGKCTVFLNIFFWSIFFYSWKKVNFLLIFILKFVYCWKEKKVGRSKVDCFVNLGFCNLQKSTPTLYNRETRYKGQKRVAVGRPVRSSQDQSRSDSSDLKELNFNGTITDPTVPAIQMNEDEPDQDENVVSKKKS